MITSREMQALELNARYFGISRLQLMENAGKAVADEIASRFDPEKARITVFSGLGGNGGDGLAAARHLVCLGFKVRVMLAGRFKDIRDKEAKRNWLALQALKDTVALQEIYDSTLVQSVKTEVVVDALLGIGLKGALKPPLSQIVKKMNEADAFRVSVDVPTGVDSDSGRVSDEAVEADLTITFHKMKLGLKKAKANVGELIVRDIGLPQQFERFAGPGDVSLVVKARLPEAHKGDFGRLLVVGGSETFSGAPVLVALSALRAGVDVTYIASPHRTAYATSSMTPDLITLKLEGDHLTTHAAAVVKRYLGMSTAAVIGPGLGMHKETKDAVIKIVELMENERIPLLLDADGLKAFAESERKVDSPAVLTPHAREYQLLTGRKPPPELQERVEDVRKTARRLGTVVLLKGNVDVISDGTRVKLNFTGNPGMTVGGTGDVLSGIVGAFLAQGTDPFEAAVAGAFINGAAGDFVQNEKGYHMVPTDLLKWIPRVMDDPMSHLKVRNGALR